MNFQRKMKSLRMRSVYIALLLMLGCFAVYSQKSEQPTEGRLKLNFIYGRGDLSCSSNNCMINSVKAIKDSVPFEAWYRLQGKDLRAKEITYNLRIFIEGFYIEYQVQNRFALDRLDSKGLCFYLIEVLSMKLENETVINCPRFYNRPDLDTAYCKPVTEKHDDPYSIHLKGLFDKHSKKSKEVLFNDKNNLYQWLMEKYQGAYMIVK
jgi:hypothetical protein